MPENHGVCPSGYSNGVSSILTFGTNSPSEIRIAIALGFSIVVILISIIIIIIIAFSKGKMVVSNKLPIKVRQIFINFTEGLQESVKKDSILLIIFYTILIWVMETTRLYLVVESLSPIHNMGISLSLIVVVALAASLLSAFPATPGGLGAVEFAIVGVFVLVGVDPGCFSRDRNTGQSDQLLGTDDGGWRCICV
ncbi:MAG: flippase-like domain-containing protein [Methanosarcinales archaeon]|nr:flippase-like domain-containing protein [Methanosarcinales archaeon]